MDKHSRENSREADTTTTKRHQTTPTPHPQPVHPRSQLVHGDQAADGEGDGTERTQHTNDGLDDVILCLFNCGLELVHLLRCGTVQYSGGVGWGGWVGAWAASTNTSRLK